MPYLACHASALSVMSYVMAPCSFLQVNQFKTGLKAIVKSTFKSLKRNRRQPQRSPTPVLPPDSPVQDAEDSRPPVDEKECTFVVDLDPDIWREILLFCDVIDIIHIGMTCRTLAPVAKDDRVWYSALLQICYHKQLVHLRFHIGSLSYAALQRKAILSARLDHLLRNPQLRPFPYTTSRISLQASTIWSMSFLPGGEWLVVLCRHSGTNQERILLCKTSDPLGQPSTYTTIPDGFWSDMRIFTSDQGDVLLLLRSERFDGTHFSVYRIHRLKDFPSLERVCTLDTPKIENFAILGRYLVFGWLDSSDNTPKHYVKVMRFTTCYRGFSDQCVMELERFSKSRHSYGLRVTNSRIIIVVSSVELITAYTVALISISSHCEPIVARPFWRFSCAHVKPRAVHLIPSLPAVDTPSIVIFYGYRYLFIAPSFDADPPDSHPTYCSTYTNLRSLKRPILLGPHRAFWDLGGGRIGIRALPTPLLPVFHDHDYWHASAINTPEADLADDVRPLVYAESYNRKVERAAWDEESGKLALFPRPDHQRDEHATVFIVDMM